MIDHFALLNEPRRPWLDPEALKAKFLTRSTKAHPDRVHGATASDQQAATALYTALNAAFQTLRDPKSRLQHLLELELGHKPSGIQQTPAGAMDLFMEIGQVCRDVDQFVAERAKTNSPMVKVQLFARGLEWTDKLLNLQQTIRGRQDKVEVELRSLNASWEAAPAVGDPARAAHLPLARLEEMFRLSSHLARWGGQLQARVVQLSL